MDYEHAAECYEKVCELADMFVVVGGNLVFDSQAIISIRSPVFVPNLLFILGLEA